MRFIVIIEYQKSRAAINFSYFIIWYLSQVLTQFLLLYIPFIHPFANFLHNQNAFKENSIDDDYLFCSEESSDLCWKGKILSEVLQRETKARLGVKINLWPYRHFVIAIAEAHVKAIAAHFDDDALWEQMLASNQNHNVFAWQAEHERVMNVSTYWLDQVYPSRLQLELLHEYLRISRIWHRWLGFLIDDVIIYYIYNTTMKRCGL